MKLTYLFIIPFILIQSIYAKDTSYKIKDSQDTIINWTEGNFSITVKERIPRVINDVKDPNYGKPDYAFNVSEARNKSYTKAKDKIQIKLVKSIENLPLDDRSTILEKISTDEKFRERFNQYYLLDTGSIQVKYVEDSVMIRSEVSFWGKNGIMNYIPLYFGKEPFPKFSNSGYPSEYSGLVIDARHLPVKPALLPRITSDKGLDIYSYLMVNKNYAIDKGLVSYQTNPVLAMSDKRVGNKPFFVVAQTVSGANHTNLTIPTVEAIKLLSHPNTINNLRMCRVIILIN
jgi:hypothetical protein